MLRHLATALSLLFLSLSSTLAGCDSSEANDGCVDPSAPGVVPGTDPSQCPKSVFGKEDFRSREVAGIVYRGLDGVPGAAVRLEGWAPLNPTWPRSDTVTDVVGFYGTLRSAPLRYDLSITYPVRAGGRQDVLVYRGAKSRYLEPSIEVSPRGIPRSWAGKIDLRLDAPIPNHHSLVFFASGEGVFGVTGEIATGLMVRTRDFVSPATIHVVEIDSAKGLAGAVAYGKVDVVSDVSTERFAQVRLEPLTATAEPTFAADLPAGFVPGTIEVRIGYSQTSDAVLVSIPVGTKIRFPVIPNAGYTYQLRARRGEEVSDSGEVGFDIFGSTTITMPAPPTAIEPADGALLAPGAPLVAEGEGLHEHVLVPLIEGPAIRVVTRGRDTVLPDVAVLGARPAAGPYTWSVRRFPKLRFVDELSGIYARRYVAVGTSAPRRVELR